MTHRPAQMPASEIYQLKITLKDIRPPIWRRIQVSGDVKLSKLHQILQVVMGWTDSHLHQFVIRGKYFCEPNPEADFGLEKEIDEKTVRLSQVVPCASRRFSYKYDFGDGWRHEILVEKILPGERGTRYPVCLAGKRNCPPEDCGGPWGYAELLEALFGGAASGCRLGRQPEDNVKR